MNIFDMASQAGLQVLLDARIGNETYHSVSGSLAALQRFADAIAAVAVAESASHVPLKPRAKHAKWNVASARKRRARRVSLRCGGRSAPGPLSVLSISSVVPHRERAS